MTSVGAPGSRFVQKKGTGYISSIFHEEDLVKLRGNLGIGKLKSLIESIVQFFNFVKIHVHM